ncbi:MAG: hypothetical protein IIZ13_14610 [Renibacterium sp.]|nr:hypothetical protein [Renibacterium sp.]
MEVQAILRVANNIALSEHDEALRALHILRATLAAGVAQLTPEEANRRFSSIFPNDSETAIRAASPELPFSPRVERLVSTLSPSNLQDLLRSLVTDPDSGEVAHFLDLAEAEQLVVNDEVVEIVYYFPEVEQYLDPETMTVQTRQHDRAAFKASEEAKYGLK